MASGDTVLQLLEWMPCAASQAGQAFITGGSTPGELIPAWAFDDSSTEYVDALVRLGDNYGGGGLTLTLHWSSGVTSGVAVLGAALRRIQDDAEDLDTSHTYNFNTVNATTASAAGEVGYADITFTDGADMDSLSAGELAILRVQRVGGNGSDTLIGDAELISVSGAET